MIILTEDQANTVRGETANGARLVPIKLKSGSYVLPEAVLLDENHAMHHDFLSSLPTRDIAANEWISTEE